LRAPLALLLLGVAACGRAESAASARPNIVFLLADDLGWADLGCYGSTFYETPSLDELAATGVRFTRAYAAAPVCSPTRGSILCGKYPARTKTTEWFGGQRRGKLLPAEYVDHLPLEELTLAEALREEGYATFFAGKWHLGGEGFWPQDQGFDVNVGGTERGSPPGGYFSPYENPQLPDGPEGEHLPARLADECIRFLRERDRRPFLLYLSFYSVHTPLQTTPELEARYRSKAAALPEVEERFLPEGERQCRQVQDHPVYAGMVRSLDESVGRVLRELDALGIADETIVVFTSDNGGLSTSEGHPTSNLPLRAGKGWTYEGGIREPLLVRWPGAQEGGTTCDAHVTSTDFYPTLLELAGLDPRPEQHVDGVSFAPALRGEARERGPLFWHYPHYSNQGGPPSAAVLDGDLKLIVNLESGAAELYDLAADVGERSDLAQERPEGVSRLRSLLEEWQAEVGARGLRAE